MPFEYCTRHLKRWERGASVCLGCHEEAVRQASNSVRLELSNAPTVRQESNEPVRVPKSNAAFDKKAYQREYMRRRRAKG